MCPRPWISNDGIASSLNFVDYNGRFCCSDSTNVADFANYTDSCSPFCAADRNPGGWLERVAKLNFWTKDQ